MYFNQDAMKVKVKSIGVIVNVSEEKAKRWIRVGYAELVEKIVKEEVEKKAVKKEDIELKKTKKK